MTTAWWRDAGLVNSQERLVQALRGWLDTLTSGEESDVLTPDRDEALRAYLEAEATYRVHVNRVTGALHRADPS